MGKVFGFRDVLGKCSRFYRPGTEADLARSCGNDPLGMFGLGASIPDWLGVVVGFGILHGFLRGRGESCHDPVLWQGIGFELCRSLGNSPGGGPGCKSQPGIGTVVNVDPALFGRNLESNHALGGLWLWKKMGETPFDLVFPEFRMEDPDGRGVAKTGRAFECQNPIVAHTINAFGRGRIRAHPVRL